MSFNSMLFKLNSKDYIILFLILFIIYIILCNIFSYHLFSYKEGIRLRRIGRRFRNIGRQIERGVDQAIDETKNAAEKAAEEARQAAEKAAEEAKQLAERAKREAEEQAKRAAEEAKRVAERAAAELERLNFIKAFEKLFGAFASLENIFTKLPRQISSLFQDATNFKKNTIMGLQNI